MTTVRELVPTWKPKNPRQYRVTAIGLDGKTIIFQRTDSGSRDEQLMAVYCLQNNPRTKLGILECDGSAMQFVFGPNPRKGYHPTPEFARRNRLESLHNMGLPLSWA